MTGNSWVDNTFNFPYQSDLSGYFRPKIFASFLPTDLVNYFRYFRTYEVQYPVL